MDTTPPREIRGGARPRRQALRSSAVLGAATLWACAWPRVTRVKVGPEDVEEAVRLFGESVVPAAAQEEGFMGALLLTRDDGRALVVDLCDTLEHMRANQRNGFYQTQVAKFAGKLVERPSREFYDVAVAKGVRGDTELLRSVD